MAKLGSILLVDDDDTTNFLNRFFIRQLDTNLTVNAVTNGQEAIDFLSQKKVKELLPCLILLDTNMPVMNGWEFLETFDQKFEPEFKKKVCIVMINAVDSESVVAKALKVPNVSDTAQKPLSDLKFRVLINKHFS
ncbi:MAG: response regulator [Croceitalea sp.]|nr:response regulator [Croceitalea sp.]